MLIDDLGEPVPLSGVPARVVSLVPSLTDAIETSRPGTVVGATDYCTHPGSLDVPRVGGSKYPTVDAVLALRPDLVVANVEENRPEDVARIRADGIPVWVTAAAATVPDGLGSVRRLLTQGLDLEEPDWLVEAEDVWRSPVPVWARAVVPVWRRPWVVLGRDTFAGDVLWRLGVANVYADARRALPAAAARRAERCGRRSGGAAGRAVRVHRVRRPGGVSRPAVRAGRRPRADVVRPVARGGAPDADGGTQLGLDQWGDVRHNDA